MSPRNTRAGRAPAPQDAQAPAQTGLRSGRNLDRGAVAAGGGTVRVEVLRKRPAGQDGKAAATVSPLSSTWRWQAIEDTWRREMQRLQATEAAEQA